METDNVGSGFVPRWLKEITKRIAKLQERRRHDNDHNKRSDKTRKQHRRVMAAQSRRKNRI